MNRDGDKLDTDRRAFLSPDLALRIEFLAFDVEPEVTAALKWRVKL